MPNKSQNPIKRAAQTIRDVAVGNGITQGSRAVDFFNDKRGERLHDKLINNGPSSKLNNEIRDVNLGSMKAKEVSENMLNSAFKKRNPFRFG
jgi:hypothetical protein